jgi:succinate dehydrogenase hydrophobic anchor subunit
MVYTMTSFDDTLYYLPPMTVKIDGKPYKSKSLALKVLTFEVDTLHADQFFGPKDVQDNPFQWSDWSMPFWLSVLMLILLAVTYYLYLRLRDNKPIISHIRIVKRLLPHQKAMKEIEQIKADKMVNSENSKEYYTKLTDTLRKYIEERYGFNAMEMTSSEIIERLTASQDQKSLDELRQLFTTADLVKFAKYSTLINENDANLVNAIEFINQTKLENVPVEETVKPQLSEEDQRSQKTRRVLKWLITAIALVCLALFVYVVYTLYMLLY